MMKKHKIHLAGLDKIALRKLLRGHPMSKEELRQLDKWYQEMYEEGLDDPEYKRSLEKKIRQRIHQNISANTPDTASFPKPKRPEVRQRRIQPVWIRAAVIGLLVAATSLAMWMAHSRNEKTPDAAWITYQNPPGRKSKINLPDGSQLILNAASEVRFQEGFGETHRDITLEGESYFEVAKDSIPFRVTSAGLVTEALGTSFTISTFDASAVRVQLATGKVKVYQAQASADEVFLSPGQGVSLQQGKLSEVFSFDIEKAIAWKEGTIWMDQISLPEMVNLLERWYDVKINIARPPHNAMRFSGEFKNAMLSHLLESLAYSYRFDYTIDQKNITLTFN